MYYICKWYNRYIVFNNSTKELSFSPGKSIEKAIIEYNKGSWDTKTQPDRNINIKNSILYDGDEQHAVYFKTNNLDINYIIETYPEFFI